MNNKFNVFFDLDKEQLIEQLKEYDRLYYNEGTSPVDDADYDNLKEWAKSLYPKNSYFGEVGAKPVGEKVKLPYVLGSLNKVGIENVETWMNKIDCDEFIVTEKLDGISIYLDYNKGEVVKAMTRGDGGTGQNITEKAKIFAPKMRKYDGKAHIRAEAMLINDVHKQLGFKTRRNGAGGILNRDDLERCKWIVPFAYEILNDFLPEEADELNKIGWLNSNFGDTPVYFLYNKETHTVADLIKFLEICKEDKNYDIDGLVITPVNYKRENVEFPEKKVAFKVNEKPVDARVSEVEWRVGRTGRVIPLVHIEPIEVQGVTISKATGFNYKFVTDNKLGKGSLIKLVRSGDVIPYIVEVRTEGEGPRVPHNCPSCEMGLSPVGVDLVCKNPDCPSKSLKRVEHFLVRMGAENITIKTLVKLGIDDIEKLYEIDEIEIAQVPGFGLKRGEQIVNEVEKTLTTTPEKFISALGIPLVGRTVSRLVVDYLRPLCENDDHIMERAFTLHPDELMEIDGIGEAIANMYFKCIRMYGESLLSFLRNKGLQWESQKVTLQGLTFTLTGKGPMSRNAISTMITANGGVVRGISKGTDYLVTANVDSTSTKAKKAREYGIDIIDYEKLLKMLGE